MDFLNTNCSLPYFLVFACFLKADSGVTLKEARGGEKRQENITHFHFRCSLIVKKQIDWEVWRG